MNYKNLFNVVMTTALTASAKMLRGESGTTTVCWQNDSGHSLTLGSYQDWTGTSCASMNCAPGKEIATGVQVCTSINTSGGYSVLEVQSGYDEYVTTDAGKVYAAKGYLCPTQKDSYHWSLADCGVANDDLPQTDDLIVADDDTPAYDDDHIPPSTGKLKLCINNAGLEFAQLVPVTSSDFLPYTSFGFTMSRVPFSLESCTDPSTGKILWDSACGQYLIEQVEKETAKGNEVVIDVHNYMKYNNQLLTKERFTAVMISLAEKLGNKPLVKIDAQNEPYCSSEYLLEAYNDMFPLFRAAGGHNTVIITLNNWANPRDCWYSYEGGPAPCDLFRSDTIIDPENNYLIGLHPYCNPTGQPIDSSPNDQCDPNCYDLNKMDDIFAQAEKNGWPGIFFGEIGGTQHSTCLDAVNNLVTGIAEKSADFDVTGCLWAGDGGFNEYYPLYVAPDAKKEPLKSGYCTTKYPDGTDIFTCAGTQGSIYKARNSSTFFDSAKTRTDFSQESKDAVRAYLSMNPIAE